MGGVCGLARKWSRDTKVRMDGSFGNLEVAYGASCEYNDSMVKDEVNEDIIFIPGYRE